MWLEAKLASLLVSMLVYSLYSTCSKEIGHIFPHLQYGQHISDQGTDLCSDVQEDIGGHAVYLH